MPSVFLGLFGTDSNSELGLVGFRFCLKVSEGPLSFLRGEPPKVSLIAGQKGVFSVESKFAEEYKFDYHER